jgi:lipoyl synthase
MNRKPKWIRAKAPSGALFGETLRLVKEANLHTVCEEARCPNIGECWSRGDITIMILGDTCTRRCPFCNVKTIQKGQRLPIDWNEPERTAKRVSKIPHSHLVLTSVDRDELPDCGASLWAETIRLTKLYSPEKTVEALFPDFKGREDCLETVLGAHPEVFAHNLETVRRLHPKVRPQAKYDRSLQVLAYAHMHKTRPIVKSNIMLGHGETEVEVLKTIHDLKRVGVDILTITQYLRPSKNHLPVIRFRTPEEFEELGRKAEEIGIPVVISSPMARTSYNAGEAYALAKEKLKEYITHAA